MGIKDGMDDGSYVDVMLEQIDYASHKVDDMVYLSKVQRGMLERISTLRILYTKR